MRKMVVALAAVAALAFAAPAFAGQCPTLVSQLDQALAGDKGKMLSAEKRQQVQALRDKGEMLHKQGQHGESVQTLNQAKEMLGLM